jgi:hypothetical protein
MVASVPAGALGYGDGNVHLPEDDEVHLRKHRPVQHRVAVSFREIVEHEHVVAIVQ